MPNRPTHLLRALQRTAEVGKILVVEPPFPVIRSMVSPDRYRLGSGRVVWRRMGAVALQVEEKIHVLETPAVPPSRFRFTNALTEMLGGSVIRSALDALQMRPFVLFFGVPYNHRLIGRFGELLSVFDESGANWLTFTPPHKMAGVERGYTAIREKADVIVVATEFMRQYLDRSQGAVELLSQGVDSSIFGRGSSSTAPEDLLALPRPWLGYVGALGERLDVVIVEALADAFPMGSVVLVGPSSAPEAYFARLREKPNVHFLGRRAYRDVPRYVTNFDVSITPHKVNAETLSQRSMKFYERLSSGRPMVSTPVPPAPEFADICYLAGDAGGFVAATKRALAEDDEALVHKRQQLALQESWDNRAARLLTLIRDRLAAKASECEWDQ